MAEYDDPEGIIEEQLAQQHQSIREMKNSIDSFRAETSRHFDEIMRKSDLIMDMLRGMSNDIRLSSPSENGSEFSIMNLQPDSTNGDVASCDEGSEIEVQQVETFISTTPIAGISAASTYTTRFEETTDDIAVDGKKNLTESEVCSDVGSVFDELTESSPAVLLKAPVIEPCARYMFDELPRPFLVEQCDKNAGNVDKEADVLSLIDLQSVFGSMGDTTVSDLSMGSTKARVGEVTSKLEMLLDKNVVEEDAYKVFDKMSKLTSMEQNDNIVGLEDLILPIVELPRVLIYGSEVTEVNSFNSSSKLQFEEVCMFVTIKNRWMNAAFWIDGILMFIFDPGGCSLPQMGSDPFEFNGEKGEFRFTTIRVDTLVKAITHKCLILNASVGRDVVLYPYKLDEEDVYYNEVTWYNLDIVKSMLIIHDLCIQRYHGMYMPNDKMQACTAIFGLHKCDVNGSLLVLIATNSIPPWVALHNIDVVKPITPSVTGAQVLRQLMFPMKVYGILVLLKGEDSARHMVVGAVLIQVKNGKSLWSKGRNMKANHTIHLYLCSSSTASCMDPIDELIATMLTSSFTRTGMVFPHLGECKRVLSLINNDLMFLLSLSRSSLLRAWDWNDLFYHG